MPTLSAVRVAVVVSLGLIAGTSAPLSAQLPARPPAAPLDVMTFNIRLGTANDGDDHWTKRRDLLFEVLKAENADLVGLQEAFRFQVDEVMDELRL
jgi:hypothetical protein